MNIDLCVKSTSRNGSRSATILIDNLSTDIVNTGFVQVKSNGRTTIASDFNAIQRPNVGVSQITRLSTESSLVTLTDIIRSIVISCNSSNIRTCVNCNFDSVGHRTCDTSISDNDIFIRSKIRINRDGRTLTNNGSVIFLPCVRNIRIVKAIDIGIKHNRLTITDFSLISHNLQICTENGNNNISRCITTARLMSSSYSINARSEGLNS